MPITKKRATPAAAGALVAAASSSEIPDYVELAEVQAARAADGVPQSARVLVGFLWATGARISEAIALRVRDLDTREQMATLVTLKRRKRTTRRVPVQPLYFAEVLGWIYERKAAGDDLVFPWKRRNASYLVKRALVAAGVEDERAHPHALRHGHAIHALKNGVGVNYIQRMLGHASISSTSIYLRVTAADIREAHRGVEW